MSSNDDPCRNSLTIAAPETSSALLIWDRSKLQLQSKLGNWVAALQDTMPLDKQGRPVGYVDAERVLATGMVGDVIDFLNNPPEDTVVPISYLEGFGTVGGLPIWERLDGEPLPYYDIFKMYRDEVILEPVTDSGKKVTGGMRTLHNLSERAGLDLKVLNSLREAYHWPMRVTAFDQYREKQRQILQERAIRTMEGKHARAAQDVFNTCLGYINSHADELSPKTALAWFEAAVKLERLSYGLQPDKPGYANPTANPQPLVQINNAIQNVGASDIPGETKKSVGRTDAESKTLEILSILEKAGALSTKAVSEPIDADFKEVDGASESPTGTENSGKLPVVDPAVEMDKNTAILTGNYRGDGRKQQESGDVVLPISFNVKTVDSAKWSGKE